MEKDFDIQEYMTKGVERVVSDAIRATLKNPRESAFMLRFASASKSASKKRKEAKKRGEHVPPFLIASITSECNLHCADAIHVARKRLLMMIRQTSFL